MQDVIQAMIVFQLVTAGVIIIVFLYMQHQLHKERHNRRLDRLDLDELSSYIRQQGETNRNLRDEMVKRDIAITIVLESMSTLRTKAQITQADLDYLEQKLKEALEGIHG